MFRTLAGFDMSEWISSMVKLTILAVVYRDFWGKGWTDRRPRFLQSRGLARPVEWIEVDKEALPDRCRSARMNATVKDAGEMGSMEIEGR